MNCDVLTTRNNNNISYKHSTFFLESWVCSASCTLVPNVVSGQSISYSKEEYYEQARVVLAKIPVRYQVQRRRALSVGLQPSSTGIWVYWRPDCDETTQQKWTELDEILTNILQEKNKNRGITAAVGLELKASIRHQHYQFISQFWEKKKTERRGWQGRKKLIIHKRRYEISWV